VIFEGRSTDSALCTPVLHYVVALATFPDAEPLFPDEILGLISAADAAFMVSVCYYAIAALHGFAGAAAFDAAAAEKGLCAFFSSLVRALSAAREEEDEDDDRLSAGDELALVRALALLARPSSPRRCLRCSQSPPRTPLRSQAMTSCGRSMTLPATATPRFMSKPPSSSRSARFATGEATDAPITEDTLLAYVVAPGALLRGIHALLQSFMATAGLPTADPAALLDVVLDLQVAGDDDAPLEIRRLLADPEPRARE
jgi:hypothetical protein